MESHFLFRKTESSHLLPKEQSYYELTVIALLLVFSGRNEEKVELIYKALTRKNAQS